MVGASLMFSLMSLFVKLVGEGISSQEVVFLRSLVTLGFTFVALRVQHVSPFGVKKQWLVARGLVGYAALSCFFFALQRLPIADATVLQFTYPAFTGVLAAITLKESMGRSEVAGMGVSLAGLILVTRPGFLFGSGGAPDTLAASLAVLGAVGTAVAYVIVRKLRESDHPLVIVFYFAGISVAASFPAAAAQFSLPDARGVAASWRCRDGGAVRAAFHYKRPPARTRRPRFRHDVLASRLRNALGHPLSGREAGRLYGRRWRDDLPWRDDRLAKSQPVASRPSNQEGFGNTDLQLRSLQAA